MVDLEAADVLPTGAGSDRQGQARQISGRRRCGEPLPARHWPGAVADQAAGNRTRPGDRMRAHRAGYVGRHRPAPRAPVELRAVAASGRAGAAPHDRSQSAPRGQHRQEVLRSRPELARPHRGRQPGADAGGGEVRLAAGDSSSPPTPPGGSARPSPAPSPISHAPFGCPSTWWRRPAGCTRRHPAPRTAPRPDAYRRGTGRRGALPADRVREILAASRATVSLDWPAGNDGDAALGDIVADVHAEEPSSMAARNLLKVEVTKLLAACRASANGASWNSAMAWAMKSHARSTKSGWRWGCDSRARAPDRREALRQTSLPLTGRAPDDYLM